MERDRCACRPFFGWLLGALLVFCAVLPVTSGPLASVSSAPGATTLVRSTGHQHLDAGPTSQRPDLGHSRLHLSASTPAEQSAGITVAGALVSDHATTVASSPVTSSVARAPPSVHA